jgi:hypothetical protein
MVYTFFVCRAKVGKPDDYLDEFCVTYLDSKIV